MYYASFGILALVIQLIINHEILITGRKSACALPTIRYRHFLMSLIAYYLSDILWGFLNEWHMITLAYADTVVYFVAMSLSVLLWTRYVVAYLNRKGWLSKAFLTAGWVMFLFIIMHIIANFFNPVFFTFNEEMEYVPGVARYIFLTAQFVIYGGISLYTFIVSLRSHGKDKIHNLTVCVSGVAMAIFIILQSIYPLLPFYAIGCLLAVCLVHVFVEEDEKLDHAGELYAVKKKMEDEQANTEKAQKEKEIYNHIADSLSEEYDAIYYINIETGKYQEFSTSKEYEALHVSKNCEDFYKETRENAARYAHPDDREFAESLYYKERLLKDLEGRKSVTYKYRIMVGGEPRYFRFVVAIADDGKHFVLCGKDINDDITAEKVRLEKQQKPITFSQIAESLASNYDAIYYVNVSDSSYVGYTSHNIYGQLEVNRAGEDFFTESQKNLALIMHPQDRERIMSVVTRDYLLSALTGRRQFRVEYRMIVDDKAKYTRLSVRKSSDGEHFIIGVENIDDEVRKERELQRALDTEKERARRDELTGVKNKTAYMELEKSVQMNMDKGMDYLSFAIAVCDVNDLKKVNDTRGHKAGDEYIKAAAKLLCNIFVHSPVFRIGGDEFVIFLRGNDYMMRQELMAKLHEEMLSNAEKEEEPLIAAGMAEYMPETDESVAAIFERADNRMYEDKRELKNLAAR